MDRNRKAEVQKELLKELSEIIKKMGYLNVSSESIHIGRFKKKLEDFGFSLSITKKGDYYRCWQIIDQIYHKTFLIIWGKEKGRYNLPKEKESHFVGTVKEINEDLEKYFY